MRWSRYAPLTILASTLIALPVADIAGAGAETYRAPAKLTPGWGPANAAGLVDYAGADLVSLPAPADAQPLVDIDDVLRAEDTYWQSSEFSRGAEVALRLIRVQPDRQGNYQVGFKDWSEGEHLAYVVILHNSPIMWFGGPMQADPADMAKGPDPDTLCIELAIVDAMTGRQVGPGRQQLCWP